MTRARTSRPSSSTPNGCTLLGPVGWPKMSSAHWEAGPGQLLFGVLGPVTPSRLTIGPAKMATMISTTMKASDTMATRSLRKRRQKSCIGERATISPDDTRSKLASPGASSTSSSVPKLIAYLSRLGASVWVLLHRPRDTTSRRPLSLKINPR